MKAKRNYQIDVLKLFFTICIFLYHARLYAEPGMPIRAVANKWGWFGVHFFFIISGMLMVNSFMNKQENQLHEPGKSALQYVFNKFQSLAPAYFITFGFNFIIYLLIDLSDRGGESVAVVVRNLIYQSIPEFFAIEMCGVRPIGVNSVTWYISAMLLAMLPLYYILIKNKDFFLYIFSPLAALGLYGYFYQDTEVLFDQNSFVLLWSGGFLRACCGICFGAVAWLFADYLRKTAKNETYSKKITALEVLVMLLFVGIWFADTLNLELLYPAMLLLPVLCGIAFSGKSHIARLFSTPVLRHINGISLAIYLNHYAARQLIDGFELLEGRDYRLRYLCMILLTALFCGLYMLIQRGIQKIRATKSGL